MATRNVAENKRFVFRSSNEKPTEYLVGTNGSRSQVLSKIPSPQTSVNRHPSPSEGTPARRVTVIRNTKHPQNNQGPVDLGDFEKSDSEIVPPVMHNGQRSVYFIRRPIAPSEPTESAE